MKKRIALVMAALLAVSSVPQGAVLSVAAEDLNADEGWDAESKGQENVAEDVVSGFADTEATGNEAAVENETGAGNEPAADNGTADEESGNFADDFISEEGGEDFADFGDGSDLDAYGFGSDESWLNSDEEESIFPDEAEITELELAKDYDVKILDGESVWFSFEAKESGKYNFSSQGQEDTLGVLYNAKEKELAMNDDGESEEGDKNFAISYDLEAGQRYYLETSLTDETSGAYTVSVEQVFEESGETNELKTQETDLDEPGSEIENVELILKSKYYASLDMISPKDMKLKITYKDGLTRTITADSVDLYRNYFRVKIALDDHDAILSGGGIGIGQGDFLTGSGISIKNAGNYKVQVYLNDTDRLVAEGTVVVEAIVSESLPVVEIGKSFKVSGGEEFFRFTPKQDGYYYLEEAPTHSVEKVIDENSSYNLKRTFLEAGHEYTLWYNGEAGTAMLGERPELTGISVKTDPVFVERFTYNSDLGYSMKLIGHYSNGKEYEINDRKDYWGRERRDYWGRDIKVSLTDVNGNSLGYGKAEAGDYTVTATDTSSGKKSTATLHVYSFKEMAKNSLKTGKRQSIKRDAAAGGYAFFSYTPEESGTYRFTFYSQISELYCMGDNTSFLPVRHNDSSYFVTLEKGHTCYFAVYGYSDYVTVKAEKVGKKVQSAVLGCNKTYYAGIDSVKQSDFYLNVTYTDGTVDKLLGGRINENGDYFRLQIKKSQELSALTGSGIYLKNGEYEIKAYMHEEETPIAETTIQVKATEKDQFKKIKAGTPFHVNGGNTREFFAFTTDEDEYASYYFSGVPEDSEIKLYRYLSWNGRYYLERDSYLYGGWDYVIEYTGSQASDITLYERTESTSEEFEIELNKKYENLTIGSEYSSAKFTFRPKETSMYKLDLVSEDGSPLDVSISEKGSSGKNFYGETSVQFILKKDVTYTFYVNCKGTFTLGSYRFSALLTEKKEISTAPVSAYIREDSYGSFVGIDSFIGINAMVKNARVVFGYNESENNFRIGESFQIGENEDRYGNKYTVTLEDVTKNPGEKKEYKLKVTAGEVSAEETLVLLNAAGMKSITEEQKTKVSYGEKDSYTAGEWGYKFTPKEDGYYSVNLDSSRDFNNISLNIYTAEGQKIYYNSIKNGYGLKAGTAYYIELVYNCFGEGSTNISVSSSKTVVDVELIKDPDDIYAVYGLADPILSGAKVRVTYSDGSQEEVEYGGICGTGSYGRVNRLLSWAEDGKTFTVQYVLEEGHRTEKKRYNAVLRSDISVLPLNAVQTIDFENGSGRKVFKVHVNKAGEYSLSADKADNLGQYYFVDENDVRPEKGSKGYILEEGREYYLLMFGSGQIKLSLTDAQCEHTYSWVIDKNPTCVTTGIRHEECSKCHAKKAAVEIPATGNHHYQMIIDKEASCGTAGSKHEECTVCHTKKAAVEIPATGKHTYTEYSIKKAATIDAEGVKERKCTVCGKTETAAVEKIPATISVSSKKVTVAVGKSVAAPEVRFANGDKITKWKSAKTSIATVSKTGKITGKKVGKTTITVTLKSKKTAKITVNVVKTIPTKSLKVDKKTLTLKKGKSYQLKVTVKPVNTTDKLTFKSSNSKIVTVSSKGKIKAKKKGKATITIVSGKKKVTCKVTVK